MPLKIDIYFQLYLNAKEQINNTATFTNFAEI